MAETGDKEKSGTSQVKITVKTPKEKQEVEIDPDATVKELKEQVGKKFSATQEQLCLIFAGKILKDADTLKQHGIKDGLTVHLVIKSANKAHETSAASSSSTSPQTTQQPPNINATPFGLGALGGLPGMGSLGMGSANFMEMQQRMQREVMNNPELLRQTMENPFVQQMMSNPDIMRQLMMSNPQMRELMERNPEITHMLNNPELMRQTLELARNPAMLQELMRSQDRAMSNLESLPGGFNALQRMYRDIQEPMLNAAQEGFSSNPFASLVGSGSSSSIAAQQGQENTEPLPNPWAPGSPAGTSPHSSTTGTSTVTSDTAGGQFGMFNSPGMQSLLQQMAQNPQLMQNMMQAPYTQAMMQSMSANPELANQIISANPLFAANPELRQHMLQALPQLLQQMQNPASQAVMTNPRALTAITQIQQGMQQLYSEAPDLFQGYNPIGMPLIGLGTAASSSTSTTTTSTPATTSSSTDITTNTTTSTTTTTASSTSTTATTPAQGQAGTPGVDLFSNMMAQMVRMMAQGNINQPPEQLYAPQLEQLAAMGFIDRDANIRALQATLGDVNAAIDRLIQNR
ncbi:hypothetical protein CHS0354_037958 [Potamilus streckersoni]|uniref:Ubiquilin n=1 Tax=Potamilus streckersoni TaxID=2493646 RepID=A0AAE0T9T5_9BIVA|nr:hypothetical protein CHS0354_037958 [Potamilus streckersoni]